MPPDRSLGCGGASREVKEAPSGAFSRVRRTQAGHIHPTASERQRPVSASISALFGNVRNDRPGPLRRHIWQMTQAEFIGETVQVVGRVKVSEKVPDGCNPLPAGLAVPAPASSPSS
jgi:hypothetical protein